MATIESVYTADHRRCDLQFADLEAAVTARDWDRAVDLQAGFRDAVNRHLAAEEETVFPALERVTGNSQGPTPVMMEEHRQMRDMLLMLDHALAQKDAADFLGSAETLLILMQQHNLKEEQVLYPMADEFLDEIERADALSRLVQ